MNRFVLIEHSLVDIGGHYFEYAMQILRAAEQAGYQPVLATNRRFHETERFPESWQIHTAFPYPSGVIHRVPKSYGCGIGRKTAISGGSWRTACYRLLDGLADRTKSAISELRWRRRNSRVRGFADGCDEFLSHIGLTEGDQVFCSTMSDLDLLGLVRFLERNAPSQLAQWHLQFHFAIFRGREPDYPAQDRRAKRLRGRMAGALAKVPHHRLHFYCTTEQLANQFRRLDVAKFDTLPWPVSERFAVGQATRCTAPKPLRIVSAGAVRREKGVDHLRWLIDELWEDVLKPGKARIEFQANKKRRTENMLGLESRIAEVSSSSGPAEHEPIAWLPHPLAPDKYASLIKEADIGLLHFDADEYFARCSGTLVEFLTAGVPVIVPAGCWIAEQIAKPNLDYLEEVASKAEVMHTHFQPDMATDSGPEIELPAQSQASDLLVGFVWPTTAAPGTYVKLVLEQFDQQGELVDRSARIVGCPEASASTSMAMFHQQDSVSHLRLSVRNAYHKDEIQLGNLAVRFVAPPTGADHWPLGSIGLAAAGHEQIPALVREMIRYHDHYRRCARNFAHDWIQAHSPQETIRRLTQSGAAPKQRRAG